MQTAHIDRAPDYALPPGLPMPHQIPETDQRRHVEIIVARCEALENGNNIFQAGEIIKALEILGEHADIVRLPENDPLRIRIQRAGWKANRTGFNTCIDRLRIGSNRDVWKQARRYASGTQLNGEISVEDQKLLDAANRLYKARRKANRAFKEAADNATGFQTRDAAERALVIFNIRKEDADRAYALHSGLPPLGLVIQRQASAVSQSIASSKSKTPLRRYVKARLEGQTHTGAIRAASLKC